ncbi:hypothetical protein TKK_0001583 [Trichogramma kaykai]
MSFHKPSLSKQLKTVRAKLAIERQAGKDRNLEIINNLVADEKALDEQIKSLGYLSIDIGKFTQHRSQLNTSFDSIPDDALSGFQLTSTSSRVSAHCTPNNPPSEILQIKTDEIGDLVEFFLEDFKLELSELSTRYNETEQIKKEALQASVLDQKPTTGFWQDVRNKFYEFVYAKAESEDSEAYKTIEDNPKIKKGVIRRVDAMNAAWKDISHAFVEGRETTQPALLRARKDEIIKAQ